MLTLVPTLPAFASNSDDESSGNADADVSCSHTTGNPYQEKCGETKTHSTFRGDVVTAPEDRELGTPNVPILRVD